MTSGRSIRGAASSDTGSVLAALDPHFTHYNFVRFRRTLRCTPAMAAGVVPSR